jgi:hypothetical protein
MGLATFPIERSSKMLSKFKAFGLILMSAFAFSAVVASSATALHFTAEMGIAKISGEQIVPLKVGTVIGNLECGASSLSSPAGEEEGVTTAIQITLVPKTANCTFAGEAATVDINSCDYLFTIPNLPEFHNPVHLQCSTVGDKIVSTSAGCEVTIFPQTPTSGGVTYETGGAAGKTHDFVVNTTLSGLHYTLHKACLLLTGKPTETTFTNGTITGKTTLKGFNAAGVQLGITAT